MLPTGTMVFFCFFSSFSFFIIFYSYSFFLFSSFHIDSQHRYHKFIHTDHHKFVHNITNSFTAHHHKIIHQNIHKSTTSTNHKKIKKNSNKSKSTLSCATRPPAGLPSRRRPATHPVASPLAGSGGGEGDAAALHPATMVYSIPSTKRVERIYMWNDSHPIISYNPSSGRIWWLFFQKKNPRGRSISINL
jgi:hypothetical protein